MKFFLKHSCFLNFWKLTVIFLHSFRIFSKFVMNFGNEFFPATLILSIQVISISIHQDLFESGKLPRSFFLNFMCFLKKSCFLVRNGHNIKKKKKRREKKTDHITEPYPLVDIAPHISPQSPGSPPPRFPWWTNERTGYSSDQSNGAKTMTYSVGQSIRCRVTYSDGVFRPIEGILSKLQFLITRAFMWVENVFLKNFLLNFVFVLIRISN